MALTGKPLWLEGMFLRPQHFQQYDRWVEANLEHRITGLVPYPWGVRDAQIDAEALNVGQFQLSHIDVVFPDGTVYSAPNGQPLPKPRHLTPDHHGKKVYLALPLRAADGIEVAENGSAEYRFSKANSQIRDNARADRPPVDILVGTLNARLVIEGEPLDELVAIPVAEIESVDTQEHVALSDSFIAPAMIARAAPRLVATLEQIRGLLRSRAEMLASGATGQDGTTRSGMLDLMTLGVVNRYVTLFDHLISSGQHAPEQVFRDCLTLIGELSAYAATGRRPPELPAYNHLDLRGTFDPLLPILRTMLSLVVERSAVSIPLSEREFGIWLGEIADRMMFQQRRFVLIAQANVALETIRTQMPIQIKIGPVEQIRELVNLQLPGIRIEPLSVAPREIPFIQNAVYFELDRNNALWGDFPDSAAFALHVSGNYPGLHLELWAIQVRS